MYTNFCYICDRPMIQVWVCSRCIRLIPDSANMAINECAQIHAPIRTSPDAQTHWKHLAFDADLDMDEGL